MIEKLPSKVIVADINYKQKLVDKEQIKQYPYLAPNSDFAKKFIVIDVDHEYDETDIKQDIPFKFIITNPKNGHYHGIYQLNYPISNRNFRAISFYNHTYKTLVQTYKADPCYTQHLCKNPYWLEGWTLAITNIEYTLNQLVRPVKINFNLFRENVEIETIIEGERNNKYFLKIQRQSRKLIRNGCPINQLEQQLYKYASFIEEHLTCESLPEKEVDIIIKSIMRYRYNDWATIRDYSKPKKLILPDTMTLTEKRQAGAKYTNKLQRTETEKKILEAIKTINEQNDMSLTVNSIAKLTGLSIRYCNNYKDLWLPKYEL